MTEKDLIKLYKTGRGLGFTPNSQELNSYIYDELINVFKEDTELIDTWYKIYASYSSTGILELKFQNKKSKNYFTWCEVKFLMEDNTNTTLKNHYLKYLKNRRSKY